MSPETGRKIVDLLFQMYDEDDKLKPINKDTGGIILDFIGGEPLLNIKVISSVCDYFIEKCLETNSPWLYRWRGSICSNGSNYFDPDVQKFFKKYHQFFSTTFTIDGPQEIHDKCRIYHNGKGNYADAVAATQDYSKNYHKINDTKVTIAPENLSQLNTIIDFFIGIGITDIAANVTFEAEWTYEQASIFYEQLKQLADKLLSYKDKDIDCTLFVENGFVPMNVKDNTNWCGGDGAMLAFDPNGIAYPCLRYMPSSLGNDQLPFIIGDDDGIYKTSYQRKVKEELNAITRRSQSTDECFYCPIGTGCAWCSAWNFQLYGSVNKRCTRICPTHKARALANVYYWNKKYIQDGVKKYKELYLPKEECLKIISAEEYNNLLDLIKKNNEGI